jgi:hypothetical protein
VVDWDGIENREQLTERVRAAQAEVGGGGTGWSAFVGELCLATNPDLLVLPRAGSEGWLVVAKVGPGDEADSLDLFGAPVDESQVLELARDELDATLAEWIQVRSAAERPIVWVTVVVPEDSPAEVRTACDAMVVDWIRHGDPRLALTRRTSRQLPYAELRDAAALRERLEVAVQEPLLDMGFVERAIDADADAESTEEE